MAADDGQRSPSPHADLHQLAHELDNYLSAIRLYAELLEVTLTGRGHDVAAEIPELDRVRDAAEQSIRISRDLLARIWSELGEEI